MPAPTQSANLARIMGALFLGDAVFLIFVVIMLIMFARPYHALKNTAALFDAATNCASMTASATLPGPCSIEWANVTQRYFQSSRASSRSGASYSYYLALRRAYGETETVRIPDQNFWWRVTNGTAVKLQRWGDRTTAVQLTSGEAGVTSQNPDWALANDVHALRVMTILLAFALMVALISGGLWRAVVAAA